MIEPSFTTIDSINTTQLNQYKQAIIAAFPPIIGESPVIKQYWSKLESCFSQNQFILLSSEDEVIGLMNTVPFRFDEDLDSLPDQGWDWMLAKGISDYENKVQPNYLGGLQVIIRHKFQKLGYSKVILTHVKQYVQESSFYNLVIPIRPTKKHEYPEMPMSEYLYLKKDNLVYDPWVRTHLKSGAEIIKICNQSMTMHGDLQFWESMMNKKISKSGNYKLNGALSLVAIDVENNTGAYIEPNLWIKY